MKSDWITKYSLKIPNLGAENKEGQRMLIVDARSYAAAVANRAKGGGCECQGNLQTFKINSSDVLKTKRNYLTFMKQNFVL